MTDKKHEEPAIREGFAGNLAGQFVNSKLTPLLAIASVLIGIAAVFLTPKEEEPQISVPMIDITTMGPGLNAKEVERFVTEPIERGMWGLDGVEYIYSTSRANMSLVTVRFKVGEPMEPSLIKVHHKLQTIRGELPKTTTGPKVQAFSIDDVPFLTLTFSSETKSDYELRTIVAPLARELQSTPDISRIEFLGGQKRSIRVIAQPEKLKRYGVSLFSLADALKKNHQYVPVGKNWGKENVLDVEVGGKLTSAEQIQDIPIGQRAGNVVKVKDVAKVIDGPEEKIRASVLLDKDLGEKPRKAVSIVFAKRKGTNIVILSKELIERAKTFAKTLPEDIKMSVLRDYGETANAKTVELIEHLIIATISVAILIALFMGLKASSVVVIAIPITLALTLAIYYFMGYTLNRVTLFALIFSIGILVDDAIVVVENIERHLRMSGFKNIIQNSIRAVAEIGNPTILATFTVIAAVLPMAFVRGLMGPYMRPIPVGASLAMILSLFVAFMVTPWAAARLFKEKDIKGHGEGHEESFLDKLYRKSMNMTLGSMTNSILFGVGTVVLLVITCSMFYFKAVKVKMLPFDNKNEFQVLVDYPTDTPLDNGLAMTQKLAKRLLEDKDITKVQVFAGEPHPYSFSGMVKHTFLRQMDYMNDLQVVLKDKSERKRDSHTIIAELRKTIFEFGKEHNAITKVLEIPPGPPVLATMVAEIYGPNEETRRKVAKEIYDIFNSTPGFVDLDYSWREQRSRQIYAFDYERAGLLGVSADMVAGLGHHVFGEVPMLTLDDVTSPEPVSVNLSVDDKVRSSNDPFANQIVPSFESGLAEAKQLIKKPKVETTDLLMRKNLKPVTYVLSELTGEDEAPVYGIMNVGPKIKYPTQTADVPWDTNKPVVKWDGEWFITYEVFRDMGVAFAAVVVLIYVLVVAQFKSFLVPLVILVPIPISLIGILPGHWVMGAYFTATSMIGFIAGAGVIVRNSIILVDFIEQQIEHGLPLKDAVINAGVLRFRPMLLVAAAVVVGSAVMLWDPIFQGLAISLMSGEIAATLLSRFAVPVLYYRLIGKQRENFIRESRNMTVNA